MVVYPQNGTLYSNENECPTATHINMDASYKHNSEWKTPKEYILYDFICIKFNNSHISMHGARSQNGGYI